MPPVDSATITLWPRSARARATARPTTPAPMTRTCMIASCRGSEALARPFVEEMHELRIRRDADLLAGLGVHALAEHAHDIGAGEPGKHLSLRSGRLDNGDLSRQPIGVVEDEMLRPDAIDHGLPVGGRRRNGDRQGGAVLSNEAASLQMTLEEVHGRRADE